MNRDPRHSLPPRRPRNPSVVERAARRLDRPLAPASPSALVWAGLACGVLAWGGCTGTDVGNPMTVSRVEGAAVVEAPPSPASLALPTVEIDEVWLGVTDIGLGLAPACTGGPKEDAPTAFELVAGAELPEPPALEHGVDDVVCGVTFRLGPLAANGRDGAALPQGAPEDLRESSVVVLGRRRDGVPLELRDDLRSTVKLVPVGRDGLTLGDPSVILAFAVDRWFAELDLAGAALTDGVLRIDATHNPALLSDFRKAFRASARLLRDPDGTGVPTPAAAAAPLAVSAQDDQAPR